MAAIDPKETLKKRAMAAAATLLGITPTAQAAKGSVPAPESQAPMAPSSALDRWTWDTSFLHYTETDRITVDEPQIGVRRDFADNRAISILATVDVISGATPLGTLPATVNTAPQTITGPSGIATNPAVGNIPTSHMSDTRIGLNGSYERPVNASSTEIFGAEIGKEHDFLSLGTNYTRNRDFNHKDTTLSFGISPEFDIVTPNGGLPFAYATAQAPGEFEGRNKTKYVVGGLFGITQVISRQTLMQWNYSPTFENGYLSDPYKLLSLANSNGDPLSAIHEKRPGYRLEHSFYWLTRYNLMDKDVFSLGLRYFADSWGIHSQTIDFTYRWQYHERRYVEPRVRYYHQTAADFFRASLLNGSPLPDFASADYRLNAIDGVTFGGTLGYVLENGSELLLRAEYYTQSGDSHPDSAIGQQRAFDLFPTLNALIFQVEYRFEPSKVWKKR